MNSLGDSGSNIGDGEPHAAETGGPIGDGSARSDQGGPFPGEGKLRVDNGGYRILVALEDFEHRTMAGRALRELGYLVVETGTAGAVLAALDSAAPDLLLLDTSLAEPNQPPLLSLLHVHPVRASMAILALAPALLPPEHLLQGADQVLPAPFAPLPLRFAVQALLRLKQAEAAARDLLNRRSRDQLVLQQVGFLLAAAQSLPAALQALAQALRSHLGFDRVALALYDQPSTTLRPALATDQHGQLVPADALPPINLAPASPARALPPFQALLDHGHDLFFLPESHDRAPAYFRPLLDGPVHEALLVALRTPDHLVAVLAVDNLPSRRPLTPDDAALLLTLAGHAALAIDRLQLAQALDARARQAEAAAQISTLLAANLDPAPLYPPILHILHASLACDLVAVLVSDGSWLRIAASTGSSFPDGSPVIDLLGGVAPPLAAARGGALRLPDQALPAAWQQLPLWLGEPRLQWVLVAPIHTAADLSGALIFGRNSGTAFTDAEQRSAAELAAALAPHRLHASIDEPAVDEEQAVDPLSTVSRTAAIGSTNVQLLEDLRLLSSAESERLSLSVDGVNSDTIIDELRISSAQDGVKILGAHSGQAELHVDRKLLVRSLSIAVLAAARLGGKEEVRVSVEARGALAGILVHCAALPASRKGEDALLARLGTTIAGGRHIDILGLGLGLYLARLLAEAQGGALQVQQHNDRGTGLLITCPTST